MGGNTNDNNYNGQNGTNGVVIVRSYDL
jgi:hypothetical protein